MKHLKRFVLSLGLLAGTSLSLLAQATLVEKVDPRPGEPVIPYSKYKLPNGLTVIVHEDHSDPVVTVRITYHVGSARESQGKSGFAHFFEHMLFQGSLHVKDEEHFRIVQESGGQMNGNTERDRTNYYNVVPSNQLETVLWLEADRMGFLLDSVTQKKFENQRDAVKNEKSQNVDNVPYGKLFELRDQYLYPPGHPYSWPVIGYVEDLNRVNVDDLKNFFLRWYGPNNAVLVVAGDVKTEDVVKMAEKYFGPIPKGKDVIKPRLELPMLPENVYVKMPDDVYLPLTEITYPAPPQFHPDEAAVDILAFYLGGDRNSPVYQKFIKGDKALQAGCYSGNPFGTELAGEFTLDVLAYPEFHENGISSAEVEKLWQEVLAEFEKNGISDADLARIKGLITSGIYNTLESNQSKATALADWHTFLGRTYNLNDELKRYEKVTKEDVMRVFNRYIKGKPAVITNIFPGERTAAASSSGNTAAAVDGQTKESEFAGLKYVRPTDNFDRSVRPVAGPAKPVTVPSFYSHDFANGIKLLGTKTTETPRVTILIELDGGHMLESPDKAGVAYLLADLMNESTQNYTAEQLNAELQKLGSSISFSSGTTSSTIVVQSIDKNLDATLKLLEEKLLRPKFDETEFKRAKKQAKENANNQKKNNGYLANVKFNEILYGKTVLGVPSSGTYKSLEKITLDDLKAYYQNYYSPKVASIVVAGNIEKDVVVSKLAFLGNWTGKEVSIPAPGEYPALTGKTVYFIDKPGATSSQIIVGTRGPALDLLGEFYKTQIMNFPVGGNFNSRVNLNLREEKGYTYGIYSGVGGTLYGTSYAFRAAVRASATDSALVEVLKEIDHYRQDGPTQTEVTFTKNAQLGAEALQYETPLQKAYFLSAMQEYKLPADYVTKQLDILNNMTAADMKMLAEKYLKQENLIIIIVGDKNSLKKRIEKLGFGKVVMLDADIK